MSGGQSVPDDAEGAEVVRQFQALRTHPREAVYSVCGNHDRSGLDQPRNGWWRKWIDPMGEFTENSGVRNSRRPYPVHGNHERYSFRVGNLLFLMMSDVNHNAQTIGRGDLGGNPGGVVTQQTFDWWRQTVRANRDALIVSVHHYVLKNTTVASGDWEGMKKNADGTLETHYHGYKPYGTPKGASYLYVVGNKRDSGAFEQALEASPASVAMWLGGHTHTHPDDRAGDKSHIETRWGTLFMNVGAVSRHHGSTNVPMSRLITLTHGSRDVRIQCYLHTDHYAPRGWYEPAERTVRLARPFEAPTP
jgi:hypothetical protein